MSMIFGSQEEYNQYMSDVNASMQHRTLEFFTLLDNLSDEDSNLVLWMMYRAVEDPAFTPYVSGLISGRMRYRDGKCRCDPTNPHTVENHSDPEWLLAQGGGVHSEPPMPDMSGDDSAETESEFVDRIDDLLASPGFISSMISDIDHDRLYKILDRYNLKLCPCGHKDCSSDNTRHFNVICKGCNIQYSSIADRMVKPPGGENCPSCVQKTKWG